MYFNILKIVPQFCYCLNLIFWMAMSKSFSVHCSERVPWVTATIVTDLKCIHSGAAIWGPFRCYLRVPFKFRWFKDSSDRNEQCQTPLPLKIFDLSDKQIVGLAISLFNQTEISYRNRQFNIQGRKVVHLGDCYQQRFPLFCLWNLARSTITWW